MSDYKFPLLMKSTATGLIILAEGITSGSGRITRFKGTVKGSGNGCSSNKMGDYREDWCLGVFEPFEG
jgi:hypothetical protein